MSFDGIEPRGVERMCLRDLLIFNYARLHRRLVHRLGSADLASECLHDTWLRLGDQTVPEAIQSPQAYVYRAACNMAVDRLRASKPWQFTSDEEADLEQFADPAPGPDLVAGARSDLAAVERAIQRLPRRHRAVLIALRIEERSRQDVAQHHGISLGTLDTTLRQALQYCAENSGQQVLAGEESPRHRRVVRQGYA